MLIALLHADHSLHARATKWFAGHARHGWACCPITQNGCAPIMSHPGYPNALPIPAVTEHLATASTSTLHELWPDDVSVLDPQVADSLRIHGPHQRTDRYLLALALRHGRQFVTFDTSISLETIRGAEKKPMVTLLGSEDSVRRAQKLCIPQRTSRT